MSNSFFASVRRNQKQWMVVVTVLSMVSFLFLDYVGGRKGPMTPFGGGLMIGCLVAAGMCIIGYPRGLTAEFGSGGFLAGFLAGFLGFGAVGVNRPLVRTSAGNYSRQDLDVLASQRLRTNQFISNVGRKLQYQDVNGFGQVDDASILEYQMLLTDAKKMGIQISDERVNDFLRQFGMSKADYKECLRAANLGENELFDSVKQELSVQLLRGLTAPPAFAPMVAPELARLPQIGQFMQGQPRRFLQQTPLQLWSEYEKLTLKESLQAVAIPVKDFVGKVGEPSESEIMAFFEMNLNKPWTDEARPGFTKMPRVQLAYLTADFEKFEKGPDPTDAEVQEYYEENKGRYRVLPEKESVIPKDPDATTDESKPAEKTEEVPKADDAAKPKDGESKTDPVPGAEEKKPADEKKPAAGEVKEAPTEKPKESAEKPPSDDPKSKCGDDAPATTKPATENAAKEKAENAKTEPAAEKPAVPADSQPAADKPAADKPESTGEERPKDKPSDGAIDLPPALNQTPDALPGPKYRDLDDELKLEIRELILRERTFEKITVELDKAYDFMVRLGLDYDTTLDAAKKTEKAKEIAVQLQEYAQAHKLEYKETPELTYQELSAEPIGSATESKNSFPLAYDVFVPTENGEPRIPLYSPHRADSKHSNDAYAYWKIAQFKEEPSNLKDEAVRERVISAWKFNQARSLAEKRAQDLVAKVKADKNDLTAALATETITGEKDAPVISVIPTDPFTWLTTNKNVARAMQSPSLSVIPLIDDIGPKFMQTVFEELNDGDVGLASDEPRSTFYVVKVLNRETGKEDEGGVVKHQRQQQFMKEEFVSTMFPLSIPPYQYLAAEAQQQIDQAWEKNFQQEHSVDWDSSAKDVRPMRPTRRRR